MWGLNKLCFLRFQQELVQAAPLLQCCPQEDWKTSSCKSSFRQRSNETQKSFHICTPPCYVTVNIAPVCVVWFSVSCDNADCGVCSKIRHFKARFRPVFHVLHYHNGSRIIGIFKVMWYLYSHYKIARNLCVIKRSVAQRLRRDSFFSDCAVVKEKIALCGSKYFYLVPIRFYLSLI